jgi:outer membrane immunogenic protein
MRRVHAIVAAAIVAASAPAPAGAVDLYPDFGGDLGPIKWGGFIVAPSVGYETLHLNGSGSNLLGDPSGWRVGGEVGYDYQVNRFVLGAAADGFYTWYAGNGQKGDGLESKLFDFGTVRGRLGYTFGRFMVFGTGGYAFGDLEVRNNLAGVSDRQTLNGWTAGGGVEWAYNKSFILRTEVAHTVFDPSDFSSLPAGRQGLGANLDLFKIGLITKF